MISLSVLMIPDILLLDVVAVAIALLESCLVACIPLVLLQRYSLRYGVLLLIREALSYRYE